MRDCLIAFIRLTLHTYGVMMFAVERTVKYAIAKILFYKRFYSL